ncbi:cell filamentation protein Fic [Chromatiales bacterium (ex Bugula neritina AB1)]|nr:cell filamentation protein Fic [Chromatiales bacterium (ex Bugula neritina AB1)]
MPLPATLAALDELKALLDSHRPLSGATNRNLREDLALRWTYHSNAIEGNTLTLLETKVVLEGITVCGKSMHEQLEATNHFAAIDYVEEIISREEPFSSWQIRNIHQLVLNAIDNDNAGRWRTINVTISGAQHRPPSHTRIPELIDRFIDWVEGPGRELHPVERAALVHAEFVGIHPFADCNGRTSRLLMNLELMKAGFPPCIITVENRLAYYQALDDLHTRGKQQAFIELVCEAVQLAFEPYWHALDIQPGSTSDL